MGSNVFSFLYLLVSVLPLAAPESPAQPEGIAKAPGKLLVVPVDGSHWVGIKAVAEEMGRRGHSVLVLIPEVSMRLGPGKHFKILKYPVPYTQDVLDSQMEHHSQYLQNNTRPLLERIGNAWTRMKRLANFIIVTSESLLFNEELVAFLREQKFDAVLTDPVIPTGAILAHNLSVPPVHLLRGIPCGLDIVAMACPSPPSYVPRFFTRNTDYMNFPQRVANVLVALIEPVLCKVLFWQFDGVASRFLHTDTTVAEILAGAPLWLLRYDFTMELPRPLMPNMVLIGGINCAAKRSLTEPSEPAVVMLWGLGLLLCLWWGIPGPALGDRVLVMPVDGSHWLSMKLLVNELAVRGHEVLVLVPETSILLQGSEKQLYRTESFAVPFTAAGLAESTEWLRESVFYRSPPLADISTNLQRLLNFTNTQVKGCEALLYNGELMERLRSRDFHLLLTDPFLPCGPIIADALTLPAVYFLRGMPCGLDLMALQCPSPPSYVPRYHTDSTDRMGFLERVNNFVMSGVELQLCRLMYASFDELAARYLERQVTYRELLGQGAIWLLRYDFTFEYPRPLMPNMVHIGGINCVKSQGLSAELEEFVEGSGEHGIVVFTLGSLVSSMPAEKAAIFFSAFGQIPQRVLWRHSGPVPDNIPENVKLMKWLPQNDLLAHPKARAFITHGGSHGIYEGICHGVPMVMMPLFGDQNDNVHRVVSRGVAVSLSIFDVTAESLVDALGKVINDSSYKENMQRLSAIHNDRPIKPLDLAVFWTEFVMRHKGAEHLRPAAHHLNWIQYHCLDVICFLLVVIATVVMVTVKCCTMCLRRCCRGSQKTKED